MTLQSFWTGTLSAEDDTPIVVGNHRDAWVFGAADPNSGSAAMVELVRGLNAAWMAGWRPTRTIVVGSWDAEEFGITGSTVRIIITTFKPEVGNNSIRAFITLYGSHHDSHYDSHHDSYYDSIRAFISPFFKAFSFFLSFPLLKRAPHWQRFRRHAIHQLTR